MKTDDNLFNKYYMNLHRRSTAKRWQIRSVYAQRPNFQFQAPSNSQGSSNAAQPASPQNPVQAAPRPARTQAVPAPVNNPSSSSSASVVGVRVDYNCPDRFGFFPHHKSCDKYYSCENGTAILKVCGNGLVFDDSDSTRENCAYPFSVDCGERTDLGKDKNGIASFLGCIGNDYFGKMMEKKAKSDGVKVLYVMDEHGTATGTCAVLITDKGENRSLCAYLGAAEKLTKEHLMRNFYHVEKAKIFYLAGHLISVTPDSVIALAKQTLADKFNEKTLMLNLGAPYVSEKHINVLNEIMPNIDYLFGNNEEFLAFAKAKKYSTTDLKEIAKLIANEPKIKGTRFVIITQGSKPVIVAKTGVNKVDEFSVPAIDPKKIIDTNGAGDAFTGGFIAYHILKKPFEECIRCAIYCAGECIQRLGCTFPKEFKFK
ncbi:hypothetical protein RND71_043267 [Anisodus tanguticus]|uniref:adenosine kinase n=1 Tax=Anisodus tanguticus TaxID=243964 RepID=A0AAE1UU53_9SOLA|nr:hypothetical protein RND71_043267 [Anisodus tanguticus]